MFKLIFLALFTLFVLPGVVFAHSVDNLTIIHLTDQGFSPDKVEIKQGESVVFENTSSEDRWPASDIHPTHGIYPEFDSKKAVKPGRVWQFKFDKNGIWKMHDHLRPQFSGQINVLADASKSREQQSWWSKMLSNVLSFLKKNILVKQVNKASDKLFSDEEELFAYVKKYGPKQTINRLNELSQRFGDCHQTAHKAGRFAYEVNGEKAFQLCSAECHSGCYHGATEAYFRDHGTAKLVEDLNIICSSELNPFFSHQCLHGVGHGLMAWSNYELKEALKSCDLLAKGEVSCWTGVFMENIVGGLTDQKSDHYTKYLSSDPQFPCNEVEEKYKSSCYFLQTSRMIQIFGDNFKKVAQECLKIPKNYQQACFESMGRDIGGISRGKPQRGIDECLNAPFGQMRIYCLNGAAQDSFWDAGKTDDAITFCKKLIEKEEKQACYSTISQRSTQLLDYKEKQRVFCSKFEQDYQNICLSLIN